MLETQIKPEKQPRNKAFAKRIEDFLADYFCDSPAVHASILKATRYSLLQKGAKRFRANLACLTSESLGVSIEAVIPFAAALECVHTYSLIHDDLPCMDNDDFRRGEPTNHKVYGEATALLAGDALITEAFSIIAKYYFADSQKGLQLVGILSRAAGMHGMISGQVRDLESSKVSLEKLEDLQTMHEQKTGALILVALEGAAIIAHADAKQTDDLKQFGKNLGLAFQVKDDLLDFQEDKGTSYTSFMGYEGAENFLRELTARCLANLETWGGQASGLREMAQYNFARIN